MVWHLGKPFGELKALFKGKCYNKLRHESDATSASLPQGLLSRRKRKVWGHLAMEQAGKTSPFNPVFPCK